MTINSTTSDYTEVERTPEQLRQALTADIRRRGIFRTTAVEDAFSRVPRHVFLPGVRLEEAYAQQVVVTRRGSDGAALSSASKPSIVAGMLEQLMVKPGDNVLEIGTATGINAALLAELTGPAGHVTTIEIDTELAAGARRALAAAGYEDVTVVSGDGAAGHATNAPFDRIIVTAGAWDISPAWWEQLAVDGRIVVPLVLHGSGLTRSLAFRKISHGRLVVDSAHVCGFIGMRGSLAETHQRRVDDADDLCIHLEADVAADDDELRRAFATPSERDTHWTGIVLDRAPAPEQLDLWLTTATAETHGIAFARVSAGTRAHADGLATPALRWGGAALTDGAGSITYLTLRERDDGTEELGICTHGADPARQELAAQTLDLLCRWVRERPGQPVINAYRALDARLPGGQRIDKSHSRLAISW